MSIKTVGASLAILILIAGVAWYTLSTNSRIDALQSGQSQLRGELTATQVELGTTSNELSSTKVELSSTKQELASTRTDLAAAKENLTSTRESLATTQGDLLSTQVDLTTTRTNLAATQTELSTTREELATTATSLSETQRDLTSTRQNLSATRTSLEATQSDLASTQESLTSTRRELDSTRQDLSSTKRDLNLTQQDLDAARQELSRDLDSQVAGIKSEVTTLESQVSRLEGDVQSLDTQLNPPPASLAGYRSGSWLERNHRDVASQIGVLDWIRDGTSDLEDSAAQELIYTALDSPEAVSELTGYAWVVDGIVESEKDALDHLNNSQHGEIIQKTVGLPWVRDGITPPEVETLQELGWLAVSRHDAKYERQAALVLLSKQWMLDGTDSLEADLVEELRYLARRTWEDPNRPLNIEPDEVLRIFSMPFLETVEAHDLHAVRALSWLTYDLDHFEQVLLHDSLEAGITDELAPIVATLGGVASKDPGFIDVLLGSDVHVQRSTVSTMMSEQVDVTVVRVGGRRSTSLRTLSETIQEIEEYMGVALPTDHVILIYDPSYSDEWAAGNYYHTHIAARPEYDTGESGFNPDLIAHEVTHYYFHSGKTWISEGIADTLQILIPRERTRSRSAVTARNGRNKCTIQNLKSLDAREVGYDDTDQFYCHYYLGEKLFVDLYKALGEIDFRRALRTLYRLSEQEELDISHIREVFGTSPRVLRIINRHYDGS